MPSEKPRGRVVSAGVDWLTCTVRAGTGAQDFVGLAHEILNARAGEGWETRRGRVRDYRTIAVDGVMIGEREEDYLVQLSGDVARREWAPFARGSDSISRLDVQVTYELPEPDVNVARYMLRKARENMRNRRGLPPKNGTFASWSRAELQEKFRGDIPDGQTMYLGAPASDFRLIGYDKGAESGAAEPGTLWRNELRLRRQLSKKAGADLLKAIARERAGDMLRARDRVHAEVSRRGIPPRFGRRDAIDPLATERETTDKDRWERWAAIIGPAMMRKAEQWYGREWPAKMMELMKGQIPTEE